MKKIIRSKGMQTFLLILVLYAIGYAILQTKSEVRKVIQVGQTAPNFALTSLNGQEIQLTDYRGKGVILNFWATWCNPCVNELPLMNEAYKLIDGVEIVAVNVGEKNETVQKFANRYDLKFPILLDLEENVKKAYKVTSLPLSLLIDENGIIKEMLVGELNDFEKITTLLKQVQPQVN
ncbi:thiol-disulfide oxidoreductase ResA [Paenibacillus eucommiae]|uniref:Peroxiredoxin n=1 Tax=Paenibacillus eucommiae TaxID=1355755 RepID=A0ABS4IPM4_9BACL|nr:thiol-disulfide oxidoreductase ResA [Paenibacillus eucommiae]MBP1989517.1 peroxiredoxin [Paenibacillus eucommiae]